MCLHQGSFGGTRSLAGGGETYRWSDAADAVQVAIRVRDVLGDSTVAVRHAIGRDDGILDLAFERGREAVSYYGKAAFELIVVHGALPLSSYQLLRQTLIVGQVSRLIWYVDNFRPRCRYFYANGS
jgi:hypothetical protein